MGVCYAFPIYARALHKVLSFVRSVSILDPNNIKPTSIFDDSQILFLRLTT